MGFQAKRCWHKAMSVTDPKAWRPGRVAALNEAGLAQLYDRVWKQNYGSIAVGEILFLQDLISDFRPRSFLEIGMASGLSTGLIAHCMDHNGGGTLLSFDYDDTFFGDPTKPNGFLFPEVYTGSRVDAHLLKFKIAPDVVEMDRKFDMAFIDANHQHPWPGLDMMCVWPYMTGPRIMVHHDLQLFLKQDVVYGIGPKFLYDQFPDDRRIKSEAENGNIFAVDLDMSRDAFEDILINLFKLPWSLRTPIQNKFLVKIRAIIKEHYSDRLSAHFEACLKQYNKAGIQTPPQQVLRPAVAAAASE